ncbi:hypothetical protein Ciccas_012023 [Cichlidogyrus casuarinus]|uniref:Uncharacterized protein n=1 Tax=Cichlidogyrus casuarinus TaxID=1844966 RepID=A0ABD2PQH4_9PLAT
MKMTTYCLLLVLLGGCLAFDPKPEECQLGKRPSYMLSYKYKTGDDEMTEIRSEARNFLLVYKNKESTGDSLVAVGTEDHKFKYITPLSIQYKADQAGRDMGAWSKDRSQGRMCFNDVANTKKVCVKEGDSGVCLIDTYSENNEVIYTFTKVDIPKGEDQLENFDTDTIKSFTLSGSLQCHVSDGDWKAAVPFKLDEQTQSFEFSLPETEFSNKRRSVEVHVSQEDKIAIVNEEYNPSRITVINYESGVKYVRELDTEFAHCSVKKIDSPVGQPTLDRLLWYDTMLNTYGDYLEDGSSYYITGKNMIHVGTRYSPFYRTMMKSRNLAVLDLRYIGVISIEVMHNVGDSIWLTNCCFRSWMKANSYP